MPVLETVQAITATFTEDDIKYWFETDKVSVINVTWSYICYHVVLWQKIFLSTMIHFYKR